MVVREPAARQEDRPGPKTLSCLTCQWLIASNHGRDAVGWCSKSRRTLPQVMSRLGACWAERTRGGPAVLGIKRRQKAPHSAHRVRGLLDPVRQVSPSTRTAALCAPLAWCQCAAGRETRPSSGVLYACRVPQRGLVGRARAIEKTHATRQMRQNHVVPRRARVQGLPAESVRAPRRPSDHHGPPGAPRLEEGGRGPGPHSGRAAAQWADLLRKSPRSGKQGLPRHEQAEPRHSRARPGGRFWFVG